jgi:hypothetical protein
MNYLYRSILAVSFICSWGFAWAQLDSPDAPASEGADNTHKKVFLFADFGNSTAATNQGANITQIAYAQRPGDAAIHSAIVEGNELVVNGHVGRAKGSEYAGITVMFARDATATPIDLSDYKAMRISVSSSTASTLRIRVAGADQKALNSGCYPVAVKAVKPLMVEYIIPLSRFAPESYCGANGRSLKSMVSAVSFVEVADTTIKKKPSIFSIKKVEFSR